MNIVEINKESENLLTIEREPIKDFVNQLNLNKSLIKGTSDGLMIPKFVRIELDEEAEKRLSAQIFTENLSDIKFKFLKRVDHLGYKGFNSKLTSSDTKIKFYYQEQLLFSVFVPEAVFNPFIGPIGAMFVEKIIHGDIDVKDKKVIDLGCGSGIIGISCLIMGAEEVLFTDINSFHMAVLPNMSYLKENIKNSFKTQDLLAETAREVTLQGYFDIIVSSTPTFSMIPTVNVEKEKSDGLFTSKDFYINLAEQSYAVLKKGGYLSLWSMIPNFTANAFFDFIMKFKDYYHVNDWTIIAIEKQTKLGIFSQDEAKDDNIYMFYEIRKNANPNDVSKSDYINKFKELHSIFKSKGYEDMCSDFQDFINKQLLF